MDKNGNSNQLAQSPLPSHTFLILLLFGVGGFLAIGPILGMLLVLPFFGLEFNQLIQALGDPLSHPEAKIPIYIIQGITTLVGFIAIPWIYLQRVGIHPLSHFFQQKVVPGALFLTGVIVICFMVVNAPFIEWNANVKLPEFLSSFEQWASQNEHLFKELTEYLTLFDSHWEFLLGLVVIAVIPAVGEELFFRGLIQNQFHFLFKNIHWAIWITAVTFSAFHLQFYGLVPRILLGVLFGYLYFWSQNLLVPIIAHFVNNGFTISLVYFAQLGIIDFDIESTGEISPLPVILFTIITFSMIFYFRKMHTNPTDSHE